MIHRKTLLLNGLFITVLSLFSSTALITLPAQADGFFSKLLGSKNGADFKSLLTHVPANTSYMFANKNPIPDDVMSFHLKRGQEAFSMLEKMKEKPTESAKKTDASDDDKSAEKESKKDETVEKSAVFFQALADELSTKLAENKLEDTGISLKATSLIYGFNQVPIIRLTFADKDKIMATIKNAEEKSDYKVEFDKCGEYDCFKSKVKGNGLGMIAVILKDHLAISLTNKSSPKVMEHLMGKDDPKESFTEKQWDAFLEENNYKGFGDGFVNLKKLYENNKTEISEGLFTTKAASKAKITDKEREACTGVVDDHITNMPEIVFGTKNLEEKNMDYEMVFKTSTGVSDVLQTLANKTNIAQRSEKPIFDLGLNFDSKALGTALSTYSNFLLKSAETNKCTLIKPKDVRKSMGGMMMVMNMGLSQFKSLYLSLDELELSETMQPKKLDVLLSIGTDDPAGLLAMVGMMSPALAGFKVPEDGTPVKLPAGAIPSKGIPLPPMSISRGAKSLNIMVGNDKPSLKDYKSETPEMMILAIDGKRYYDILANLMKVISKPKNSSDTNDKAIEIMTTMGSMTGNIKEEIFADKRGLVINYHLQY